MNILQFLIPGLTDDGMDSAVIACSSLDDVVNRLCYCFSRKNLRRLSLNLVEGLNSDSVNLGVSMWRQHWETYQCTNAYFLQESKFLLI
jgi:hypothetical protein